MRGRFRQTRYPAPRNGCSGHQRTSKDMEVGGGGGGGGGGLREGEHVQCGIDECA